MLRIDFTVEDNRYTLEFEGHAGSESDGTEYICSAVSCLFYALGKKLYTMYEAGTVENLVLDDTSQYKIISATPIGECNIVYEVFDTILCGLDMLAEQYPANIDLRA